MRLNAFLAQAGVASRRKADELIKAGKVTVNGRLGQLNTDVNEADVVELDGRRLNSQKYRYILLYKPSHTVTTLSDTEGRPTVIDLVKVPERVVPVGRLDVNTTGALLLTNDGQLAHRLMHPSFQVDKVYEAIVEGRITNEILNKLSNGVKLEDGMTASAQARLLRGPASQTVELIIHEGRNHQVKRMLTGVGLKVVALHRAQYGPLTLKGLLPAKWREISKEELENLQ